jgi:hypothetical protein
LKFILDRPLVSACCSAALILIGGGAPATAHAFGAKYDLPLPLEFYLVGSGAAVALSFVIIAIAYRSGAARTDEPWRDLREIPSMRALYSPIVTVAIRILSVGLLFLVVSTGLFGAQDAIQNFAPTFVWIIWWIGLAYAAALVGNPWPIINPWSIIFSVFEHFARRLRPERPLIPFFVYPDRLGVWPAVILFGFFAWFELISESAKSPVALAYAILIYSGVTWCGMALFGRRTWLAHGEAFSLAFEVFGRFAPIGSQQGDFTDDRPHRYQLRQYASALIVTRPSQLSVTTFVLIMLSTVTFDGFKETPIWHELLQWVAQVQFVHPIIRTLHDLGIEFRIVFETAMLGLFPVLFLLIYLGFSWVTKRVSEGSRSVIEIAGLFVFSLVPIAIAYHLAHYLSFLLIAGQFIIPLASDPFGIGWNIFGTAEYQIDVGIIGAKFVWYTTVIAIIVGHVIAVAVAHFVALRVYDSVGAALRSQYPFLILMVGYTMLSLWILSQPIIGSPNLDYLRAPSGTVSLAPFEFRERCFELMAKEGIEYEFVADMPVEFDIHFHDGFTVRYAVKRTAKSMRTTRFVADDNRSYCLRWFNKSLKKTTIKYRTVGR